MQNKKTDSISPILRAFTGVIAGLVGLFIGIASLLAEPLAEAPNKKMEIATGLEEISATNESVTLSIGWPGLVESKISSVTFTPGVLPATSDEVEWSSENPQIGIIPEPRFLALILAIAVGAVFLTIRRRRRLA